MMAECEAVVSRGDRYWLVYVPAIDRYTQARHLRELPEMTADLIEVMTGTRPEPAHLVFTYDLPEANAHLQRAKTARAQASAANAESAAELRQAAQVLHRDGVALRDIGEILGVSHQRAHQLVHGDLTRHAS